MGKASFRMGHLHLFQKTLKTFCVLLNCAGELSTREGCFRQPKRKPGSAPICALRTLSASEVRNATWTRHLRPYFKNFEETHKFEVKNFEETYKFEVENLEEPHIL